jgi:hypothetical protein
MLLCSCHACCNWQGGWQHTSALAHKWTEFVVTATMMFPQSVGVRSIGVVTTANQKVHHHWDQTDETIIAVKRYAVPNWNHNFLYFLCLFQVLLIFACQRLMIIMIIMMPKLDRWMGVKHMRMRQNNEVLPKSNIDAGLHIFVAHNETALLITGNEHDTFVCEDGVFWICSCPLRDHRDCFIDSSMIQQGTFGN